jgi:nucleoid-associated protein YgaU
VSRDIPVVFRLKNRNPVPRGTLPTGSAPSSPPSYLHTVQAGETFAALAKKYYGSDRLAGIIGDANRDKAKDVHNLAVGTQIAVPVRTHVVRTGDTLAGLAKLYYGDGNKWRLLADANKDKIPDILSLRPGVELLIPLLGVSPPQLTGSPAEVRQ